MTTDRGASDALAQATHLLRQHTDAGWAAISADILDRARRAFRPSAPVRGRHDLGEFFVASDIVVSRVREAVDAIAQAAATRITCSTDDNQHLDTVTIEIIAAYGSPLLALAHHVHAAAAQSLTDTLSELAPPHECIHTHVHIDDITDDPRDLL